LRNYDLEFVEALWKPEVQVDILLINLDLWQGRPVLLQVLNEAVSMIMVV
jgi:hypothetical protein